MVTKKHPEATKEILTSSEVCGYLNLSWNTVKKLVREGNIPVTKVGRRYLFVKEELRRFAEGPAKKARAVSKHLTDLIAQK
jgi:excisionase family DNA binding protein